LFEVGASALVLDTVFQSVAQLRLEGLDVYLAEDTAKYDETERKGWIFEPHVVQLASVKVTIGLAPSWVVPLMGLTVVAQAKSLLMGC
jgi:hypothetical protein